MHHASMDCLADAVRAYNGEECGQAEGEGNAQVLGLSACDGLHGPGQICNTALSKTIVKVKEGVTFRLRPECAL